MNGTARLSREGEIDFGFQSRVERFIYWPLKLLRADARSAPSAPGRRRVVFIVTV